MSPSADNIQTANDADASDDAKATPLSTQLFLVLEAERPRAGGARYNLSATNEVLLGRGTTRAARRDIAGSLRLTVPASRISSLHARLRNHRGHWTIQDLGSTNGTFVNGTRVSETVLKDGDLIEIGQASLIFREALPTPPDAPSELELGPRTGRLPVRSLLPLEEERLRVLGAIARTKLPILLIGESGTGKEVLARAVHAQSGRTGALVAFSCGGLSPSLLESHLSGHTRGALSGATRDEPGLVWAAHGGTLFLDEIGDMALAAQAKVLRALQNGEICRVGSEHVLHVDVRVLAATNKDLSKEVASGGFREDLYFRLNVFPTRVPALRERGEDVRLLAQAFVQAFCAENGLREKKIDPKVLDVLIYRKWPGNVRELKNVVERAAILSSDIITIADLPEDPHINPFEDEGALSVAPGEIQGLRSSVDGVTRMTLREYRDSVEKGYIVETLDSCDWNISKAAVLLGVERTNLHKKIRAYGIKREA